MREQANCLFRLICLVGFRREKNGDQEVKRSETTFLNGRPSKQRLAVSFINPEFESLLREIRNGRSFVLAFSPQRGVRLPKGAASHHGPTATVSAWLTCLMGVEHKLEGTCGERNVGKRGRFSRKLLKPREDKQIEALVVKHTPFSISGSILFAKSIMKIFLAAPVSPKGDFKKEEKEWCLPFIA